MRWSNPRLRSPGLGSYCTAGSLCSVRQVVHWAALQPFPCKLSVIISWHAWKMTQPPMCMCIICYIILNTWVSGDEGIAVVQTWHWCWSLSSPFLMSCLHVFLLKFLCCWYFPFVLPSVLTLPSLTGLDNRELVDRCEVKYRKGCEVLTQLLLW